MNSVWDWLGLKSAGNPNGNYSEEVGIQVESRKNSGLEIG